MSRFSKPHSYAPPMARPKWFKPREYPWLYSVSSLTLHDIECEACHRKATWNVSYVERSTDEMLSHVSVCDGHRHLTYKKWTELFSSIDKKCERENAKSV